LSQVAAYAIVNGDEEVRSYFKIDTTGYDWYDTKEDKQRYIQNLVLSNLQDTKELLKSMAEQNASLAWIKSYSVLTGAPASYDGVVGNIISRTLNDFEANKPYVESYVYTIGFLSYAEYDELKSKYMGDHDDNTLRSNVNSVVRDVLFWKQETVMESLGKGNLQPLAIKFESRDIIYPLKISSVNNGISEVLLYVFAKYKTETKDNDLFEVEYAKWIEKEDIQTASYDAYAKRMGSADEMMRYYYPTTYYYTNQLLDDRYYLTKFRAELWPKEMEDLNFVQSDNNRPYRLVVRSEGYVASWVLFIFGLMVSMVILFGIAMLCRWFNNKFVKSENSLFFVSIRRTVVYTLVLPIILMLMFLFERFAEVFSEVIFENDLFEALGELIEFIMKLFHYLHIPDFISVLFVAIILILMIFYVLHFISTAILSVWRNIGEHGVSGVMDWNKVMRLGLFTAIAVILFLFVLFAFAEALNGKNWLTMFYLTIISVLVVTIPNILWNFVIPRMRSK
jgi:hypothetical protein